MSSLNDNAIVTLAEVKEALDITVNNYDSNINGYINRATAMIEAYCKRRFAVTIYTNEVYNGEGGDFLNLRNFPVSSISSLQFQTGTFDQPDWQDIDTSLYSLVSNGGKDRGQLYLLGIGTSGIFYPSGFAKGIANFRVTYTAGEIPEDVKQACIELVSYFYNRRRATPGINSEKLGKYAYTMEQANGADGTMAGLIRRLGIDDILDMYRTPTV